MEREGVGFPGKVGAVVGSAAFATGQGAASDPQGDDARVAGLWRGHGAFEEGGGAGQAFGMAHDAAMAPGDFLDVAEGERPFGIGRHGMWSGGRREAIGEHGAGGACSEDDAFEQRIAGQAVGAVDAGAGGFAGSTADAFALFSRFESKLEQFNGNLSRSVVELAKEWRTDRVLRHLEALLLVADLKNTYLVSGNGDVIEPDEGVSAIGSGGPFATAAATALLRNTRLSARRIVEESMAIAAKICIYTNDNITFEELE